MLSTSALNVALTAYSPCGYQNDIRPTGTLYFAGERLDLGACGYMLGNGYRVYIPALMRFTSGDEISPFGEGGLNAYSYCAGDPVNHVDPSGRWKTKTGLTALLKAYRLPKKDLKFLLRSLAAPELKGKSLNVKKLENDTFTTYRFTGESPRITGQVLPLQESRLQTAGEYFVKNNIYIESPSTSAHGDILIVHGYKREWLNSETHAFIQSRQSSVPPRASSNPHMRLTAADQPTEPNVYVDMNSIRRR